MAIHLRFSSYKFIGFGSKTWILNNTIFHKSKKVFPKLISLNSDYKNGMATIGITYLATNTCTSPMVVTKSTFPSLHCTITLSHLSGSHLVFARKHSSDKFNPMLVDYDAKIYENSLEKSNIFK